MVSKEKYIDSNDHIFGKNTVGDVNPMDGGISRDCDFEEPANYFWSWFRDGKVNPYSHDHYGLQE